MKTESEKVVPHGHHWEETGLWWRIGFAVIAYPALLVLAGIGVAGDFICSKVKLR